jgi:hypothetical protein
VAPVDQEGRYYNNNNNIDCNTVHTYTKFEINALNVKKEKKRKHGNSLKAQTKVYK